MEPIIEVTNISKEYILAHRLPYETLRDSMMALAKKPFGMFQPKEKTKKEEFWALKDINFTVQKGEAIGIIGANGSGKSTLLKILSQITSPTTGEINLRGRVASLLEVGTGFHPELTGRENVYLNGAILGMTRKEITRKFDEIVEFSGVEQFLDTPVKRYSSGMIVRLAFSVAAHLDPDILIVDEVLAVGDAEFQKKSLGKMQEVSGQAGRTVIFVSHNMEAIRRLCQKCVLLDKGQVKMFDKTDRVVNEYNHTNEILKDSDRAIPLISTEYSKDREFIFNKIWITNNRGIIVNKINHDEDFFIHLEFEVKKEISTVEISIVLKNSSGINLTFTSLSDSFDKKNYPFKVGKYVTTTKIRKIFLVPDTYSIRISAHERGVRDIDKYEEAMKFLIIDVGSTMAPYGTVALNWCSVFSDANWKIHKHE